MGSSGSFSCPGSAYRKGQPGSEYSRHPCAIAFLPGGFQTWELPFSEPDARLEHSRIFDRLVALERHQPPIRSRSITPASTPRAARIATSMTRHLPVNSASLIASAAKSDRGAKTLRRTRQVAGENRASHDLSGLESLLPRHQNLHVSFTIRDQLAGQIKGDALDGSGKAEHIAVDVRSNAVTTIIAAGQALGAPHVDD